MTRHFKDFITTFSEYNQDGYVPDKFYEWSAISLVSAVLERKVWIPWSNGNFYPNMFIFLVSKPGVGKSTAMKPSIKLIQKMNEAYGTYVRLLPNKVTEPKLLDLLNSQEYFAYKNTQFPHTSVYYFASEASACFNDPYGGFTQTLTALYDGDDITKATVSRKQPVKVINPCMNLLAGCTFDYLSKLLTTEGILGGFASRITYVVQDEMLDRTSTWLGEESKKTAGAEQLKLAEDLYKIHQMIGGFRADKEFATRYNDWFPRFDKALQESQNEKMQALMVRKSTAMRKLPMILSASESDDMILKAHHWDKALELMDTVEEKIPFMIREGQAANVNTQNGLNNAIMKCFGKKGVRIKKEILIDRVRAIGHNPSDVRNTISTMLQAGESLQSRDGLIMLMDNPDKHI